VGEIAGTAAFLALAPMLAELQYLYPKRFGPGLVFALSVFGGWAILFFATYFDSSLGHRRGLLLGIMFVVGAVVSVGYYGIWQLLFAIWHRIRNRKVGRDPT
jgi:hypothetical protein